MIPPNVDYVEAGDIRDDPSELLVCCVNCVAGVMGAGQALAFADRWPTLKFKHLHYCKAGDLEPGRCYVVRPDNSDLNLYVALFPTKNYWREPSRLEWIRSGLDSLLGWLGPSGGDGWESLAVPALGCGLGGLEWDDVRPLIEEAARRSPWVSWRVYLPGAERRRP